MVLWFTPTSCSKVDLAYFRDLPVIQIYLFEFDSVLLNMITSNSE